MNDNIVLTTSMWKVAWSSLYIAITRMNVRAIGVSTTDGAIEISATLGAIRGSGDSSRSGTLDVRRTR